MLSAVDVAPTVFVTSAGSSDSVRLSWRASGPTAVFPDPAISSVVVVDECVGSGPTSATQVIVVPRDASGDRLGAGLDVQPFDVAAWSPGIPTGGIRDLGDGRYAVEVAAADAGQATVRVEVEGVVLDASPLAAFSGDGLAIAASANPRRALVGEDVLLSTLITGGVPPYLITWDVDGDGAIDSSGPAPTVTFDSSACFAAVVHVEDASGCKARGSIRVEVGQP